MEKGDAVMLGFIVGVAFACVLPAVAVWVIPFSIFTAIMIAVSRGSTVSAVGIAVTVIIYGLIGYCSLAISGVEVLFASLLIGIGVGVLWASTS